MKERLIFFSNSLHSVSGFVLLGPNLHPTWISYASRLQKEMLRKGGKDTQNTLPISSIKVKAVQCAIFIDKKRLFLLR